MLGNWVGRIDDWVNDERTGKYADYDIDTMKHNALILPTTWASHASLVGYANREYAGLMEDYYYRMWKDFLDKTDTLVASGQKKSATVQRELYFQYAWDIIVARGEGYNREVLPADGNDSGARSLKLIYAEFVQTLKADYTPTAMFLKLADSKYELKSGKLTGLNAGTTVTDLNGILTVPKGGKLVVLDTEGKQIAEDAIVQDGYTVMLINTYGAEQDAATITKMNAGLVVPTTKYTLSVGESATIEAEFVVAEGETAPAITFASGDETIATVDENGKVTAVASGSVTITVAAGEYTKKVTVKVEKADNEGGENEGNQGAEGNKPGTDNEGQPQNQDKDGDSSVIIIVVIAVAVAVVVIAAILVVLKKKKN
jgi:hypothetical protein